MKFKNKNILVYGMSVSGEWCVKLLNKIKANVFCYDDDLNKIKNIKNCFIVQELNENLISQFDYIIISPSIESNNKFLNFARLNNVKIFSEVEFASLFCKKLVAVTGTNGKTTTIELITAILKQKYKAVACGNIGYPLSRAVLEDKSAIKVVEVSSFMLENANMFSPHVATVLNIEPDHLIRHKTMREYKKLKLSIFKNLTKKDYAVINLDKKINSTKGRVVTYSYSHIADVYQKGGYIYLHNEKIVALNELKLKGKHNVYNIMCAICFAYIYKVKIKDIRAVLLNFKADHFRIEQVAKINDITFVNDSKSTNIASTLACVESIKSPIILLLGGSKKGLNYTELFNKLSKRVVSIFAFGEIVNELEKANSNNFSLKVCSNLSEAFDEAVKIARSGDCVVLSPASASYDQFESYIERGKAFNIKVKEYEIAKTER